MSNDVTQQAIIDAFDLDQHYGPNEIAALFSACARLATAPDSEKLREAAIEECAAFVDRAAEQAEAVAEQASTGPGKHNLSVRAAAARSLVAAIRGIPRRTAIAALGASS